jgi:glycosyltransferase involved in cell wall biosynthesis
MKLGINGWRIHGLRTGIGRYLFNVARHWNADAVAKHFDEINFYTQRPVDRRDISLPANIREQVLGPDWRLWRKMLLWENLRFGPTATDDVLFCPSYSRPLVARGKTVVAMFDATLHLHPELYRPAARLFNDRLYGWSVRNSALVITGTETARQDIARSYGVPAERIRIVPLAPADIFQPLGQPLGGDPRVAEAAVRYLGAPAPYFLFVGKLTARRNVPKLMEAFAALKRRHPLPHKLLVIGLNTTDLNLSRLAAQFDITDDFKHCAYVPDEDLTLLYNGALAFVMPYTYEAVSLTALEAQATGTPVITVDTPGLRETTNGIAFWMPRAEVPDITEALARIAGDARLRRHLSEAGLAHVSQFTWQRCAAETLNVLAEAAQMK